MFQTVAYGTVILSVLALAIVPYRFPGLSERLYARVRARFARPKEHSPFRQVGPCGLEPVLWLRIWAALTILWLGFLALSTQLLTGDGPGLLVRAVLLTLGCWVASAVTLAAIAALLTYRTRSQAFAGLSGHGFKALWVTEAEHPAHALRDTLAARAKASQGVAILDVTGFELLGKGPGPMGGLLYDLLSTMTGVRVQVLLLEPETRALDPDHKQATVYQMLLKDSEMTPATYQRKVRATLDAVDALNERRPPETKIAVRYYAQKPSFREVVFHDSVLVSPWVPREDVSQVPFLEIEANETGTSLYEGFRREFSRLWRAAELAQSGEAHPRKAPSTVVRRKPKPEVVA